MENVDQQLLNAAINGDLDTIRNLATQGANINFKDRFGNTAIFSAAWNGNIQALDLLYDLGATLDLGEANLLCNSAYNAQKESVTWLIQKGADANFTLATGENALHYAISQTNHMSERTAIVQTLVNAGTDIHKKTIPRKETICFMRDAYLKGETPLHRAAAYGDEALIKILLDAGADPSTRDVNGDTPISWGSWHLRDSTILRLLLYKGVPGIH